MLLKDRVAIVTGAARGLGFACAERFVAAGAKVVLSDVDDEHGEESAVKLRANGGEAHYRRCDVTERGDIEALVASAVERHGRLDIAVANAGIVRACDPLEMTDAEYDSVLAVNLKGVVTTGQVAARQMVRQSADASGSKGSIINMSSVNAVLAIPEIPPYVVAKGGVDQWTKVLALRLAQEGVRVNAIGPGSIATEMFQAVVSNPEKYRTVMSRTPMGRPGAPEEVGDVAVFLASSMSSYITGQTIYIDGGRMFLNYTVPVKE